MVSRLCSRRVRLLLVAVTACLVLRVESGYFLIEAASLRFIVCPLRWLRSMVSLSQVTGLTVLVRRICWGDSRESLIASSQQIVKLTSGCRCGPLYFAAVCLILLAGVWGFLTGCGDVINPLSCSVHGGNGGGQLLVRVFSSFRSSSTSSSVTVMS